MSKGFFGKLFDLNGDGNLDFFESAVDSMILNELIKEEEHSSNPSHTDLDESELSMTNKDKHTSELLQAGLDEFELSLMDEDERSEALEDAGLDPFDFDF